MGQFQYKLKVYNRTIFVYNASGRFLPQAIVKNLKSKKRSDWMKVYLKHLCLGS